MFDSGQTRRLQVRVFLGRSRGKVSRVWTGLLWALAPWGWTLDSCPWGWTRFFCLINGCGLKEEGLQEIVGVRLVL